MQSLKGADGTNGNNGADGTNGHDGAQGPQGDRGPQGPDGKSAFEVAQENDPTITDYGQWKQSLKGDPGAESTVRRPAGQPGSGWTVWYCSDRDSEGHEPVWQLDRHRERIMRLRSDRHRRRWKHQQQQRLHLREHAHVLRYDSDRLAGERGEVGW